MFKFLKKLFTIRFVCPVCYKSFETKAGRNRHLGKKQDEAHIEYRVQQWKEEI